MLTSTLTVNYEYWSAAIYNTEVIKVRGQAFDRLTFPNSHTALMCVTATRLLLEVLSSSVVEDSLSFLSLQQA